MHMRWTPGCKLLLATCCVGAQDCSQMTFNPNTVVDPVAKYGGRRCRGWPLLAKHFGVEVRATAVIDRSGLGVEKLPGGFDVVIVCCSNQSAENFWQARLERGRGVIVPRDATVLCVHEDWPGGAGNGLGTLYAWTKAAKLAEDKGDSELASKLASGSISAALYHTAGKGTRLAPLPGAENNNKPGVKLPATAPLGVEGAVVPLTILESVVKSTGIYASSRKGRLSVFWGDQVFVPTKSYEYDAKRAHADILCMLAPMPSAAEWAAKGLEKYGLVAVAKNGFDAASSSSS